MFPKEDMQSKTHCPSCGSQRAKKINFTMWGSLVGPRLLSHVECCDCSCTYNSKTGRSNFWPIIIYMVSTAAIFLPVYYFLR